MELTIDWQFLGDKIMSLGLPPHPWVRAPRRQSRHEILVTMDEPSTMPQYPGISLGRMRHAVDAIGKVWESNSQPQPIDIVEHLMEEFTERFDLHNRLEDPWLLVDSSKKSDCLTICEFVLSLLRMVGCPGEITPVLAYEKLSADPKSWGRPGFINLKDKKGNLVRKPALFIDRTKKSPTAADFVASAEEVRRTAKFGGLGSPAICELDLDPPPKGAPEGPRAKAFVTLSTDGYDTNDFEACLRFAHGGGVTYFPGGVSPRLDGEFAHTAHEVLRRTFKHLRWRGEGSLDGDVIKTYA